MTNNSIVRWEPQSITIMGGMQIPADMPEEEFLAIVQSVQRYTGEFENVDKYIGKVLEVAGMIIHDAEMENKDTLVDPETGEVLPYIVKPRTVIRVIGVDGKKRDEPFYIGFVSDKVAREARNMWIPRYGPGDWSQSRFFIPRQQPTKSGRRVLSLELVG